MRDRSGVSSSHRLATLSAATVALLALGFPWAAVARETTDLLPGDALAVTMDLATNHLAGIHVATYLGQPSSPVDLDVTMGTLADGTVYSASTQLEVKAEKVIVNVANTGYRPMN